MTYEDLQAVNGQAEKTDIKGKPYVMVKDRVKAFRKLFPHGAIETEVLSIDADTCVIKASAYDNTDAGRILLATGTAREDRNASSINRVSYVENCETSAVGRALGYLGLGIDSGIASYEEMVRAERYKDGQKKIGRDRAAMLKQRIETIDHMNRIRGDGKRFTVDGLMNKFGITKLEDMTEAQMSKTNEVLEPYEKGLGIDGIEFKEIG